ncbi:hypothetical protein ACFZCP_28830 [Streptomyces sp. NPDC007971]|uniref:hypothetical protein n=1 Tax=Streptomyces sp. NPDC007971 TaxID=3364799 RepID=UPI0036E3AA4A
MGRHPQPRHITLDGRDAIALTVEEYEQLIASRRQIGGQSARVRVLAQQAKRTEQLLRELQTLVDDPVDCHEQDRMQPSACAASDSPHRAGERDAQAHCLRCAIAVLLRRHRDAAS